ncbi:MAG: hypothetical protein WCX65_03820 [bacterium]
MKQTYKLLIYVLAFMLLGVIPQAALAQAVTKEIDVLGFKFKVDDGTIEALNDKLVLKGKGSMDLSSALGAGAILTVNEMSIDHETTFSMKGITMPDITFGPFKAKIAPDDIILEKIIEKGVDPYLNLNIILQVNLGSETIQTETTIPITKDGMKNATIALKPMEGKENFLSKDFGGVILTLTSGTAIIKDKKFDSFDFSGSIDIFGTKIALKDVSVTADKITGTASITGGAPMQLGQIGLDLRGDINFTYDSANGLDVIIGEAAIQLAKIIPGATGEITITNLELAKGKISAEGQVLQKIDILGVGLSVKHFALLSEAPATGGARFTKLTLDGTVTIDQLSLNLDFTGLEIDSDGKFKGDIALATPQQLTMFGVGVTINTISFESGENAFTVKAGGAFNFGADTLPFTSLAIAGGKVDAIFDVTDSKPFSFSWFQYLKVNHLAIDQNIMTLGGKIEIPAPFAYTFAFDGVQFDPEGAWQAAKTVTASQAKEGVQQAAAKAWEKLTDPSMISLENKSTTPLTVAGFNFYIDAITIPNPLKIAKTKVVPDTLLQLYMRTEISIGDKKINVNVDGLQVTKTGVSDLTLNVMPPQGQASLFEMTFMGWAKITIDSASLIIKNKKLDSFGFAGSATVFDRGFQVVKFSSSEGNLEGQLKAIGDPYLNLAGVMLRFQGDIVFKITGGKGGGDPGAAAAGRSLELSITNISVDFSGLIGTPMQLLCKELKIKDGSISAELALSDKIELFGLSLQLNKVLLESIAPATPDGKRTFSASLSGVFTIPTPFLELTFTNFKVSSTGEFGGDLSLSALQEFSLFGVTFRISNINISKLPQQPVSVSLKGSITFMPGSTLEFTELKVQGGKLSATFNISESNPLKIPYCDFIGITKLQIIENSLKLSGYLQLPAPLGVRFNLNDLVISSDGKISGGSLALASAVTVNLELFQIVISTASFDLTTRYLSFSGELKLPSSVIDSSIKFGNMGISLASAGAGGGAMDTSNTTVPTTTLTDTKHGFPLKLTKVNFGSKDGAFFVNMSGSLTISVSNSGFSLNFENLKITQKLQFSIGMVTGGIKIAGFGLEITQFVIDDSGSDPFFMISGGISLPQIGGVSVQGLKIYKSGKVELAGIRIYVDYKAYVVDMSMSYIDSVFKVEGTILLANKGLHAKGEFSPNGFSIDLDVYGLSIPLFPGIFLDSIGGGITYQKSPEFLEFRMRCGIAFGDKALLYGTVGLKVNSTGIIEITGELSAFNGLFPVAQVVITLDVPKATLTGSAHINYPIYGVVLWLDAQVNIYASPTDFYITANCAAKIFNIFQVGYANLYVGTQGFKFSCGVSIDLGFVNAGFDFKFEIDRQFTIYASFHGWLHFDIWIASVSGDIWAELKIVPTNIDSSYFTGRLSLSVCVLKICGSCDVYLRIDKDGVHAGKNEN